MKRKKVFAVSLIIPVIVLAACGGDTMQTTQTADMQGVEQTVQNYFDGLAMNDPGLLREAFFSEAQLMSVQNANYGETAFEEWVKNFGPKQDTPDADKTYEIVNIDVAGTAACVKTYLEYPDVTYYDYLSLLKVDGDWKIVNKIFHAIPK